MTSFDHVAPDFDRFRTLPAGVPPLIREAFWTALGAAPDARLLDLGAGTGRIGAGFVAAGDPYVAVDPSRGVLVQFAEKFSGRGGLAPGLVQADGRALPFAEATFDADLL